MAQIEMSGIRRTNDGRLTVATALGLVAAALLWDRLFPPDNASPGEHDAFPRERSSAVALATEGSERGRQAASPSEIPPKGWKDILLRMYGNIGRQRVLALAAGMTYYSILAIFPALAALVAIYGLFSDLSSIGKHLDQISGLVLCWLAASGLFSWYVASFGKFNETYGSLGAVIGFMTWLWISAIVILLGAELDAEMEHQTARDSTTGAPKPLGVRGAKVADTVGAARAS